MIIRRTIGPAILALAISTSGLPAHGRAGKPAGPGDPDTVAWWTLTGRLSNDAMEGRDTGSAAYERAAAIVAAQLAKAGLQPLGDHGWLQPVAIDEIAVTRATAYVRGKPLRFLEDFTVSAHRGLPARVSAPLAYRGYCSAAALGDVSGRIVVCHATHKPGLPTSVEREAAVRKAGAVGQVEIADPGFTVEPPRWPFAYARSVTLAGQAPAADRFVKLTLRAEALPSLFAQGRQMVTDGAAGRPLPSRDGPDLTLTFRTQERKLTSSNVVGVLPGTDPALADQAIVLTAHLDGYGHGFPVRGDGLYNGTLDDAAYVALIVQMLERRHGKGFARPVIALIVTGEEKGLLGSKYWVAHPTWPLARVAADINLDQLRPIFPLRRLTVHARTDTTLGDDAAAVAQAMGITVQDDPEPERGLLNRSDHWNFLNAGIPATNFVFGYDKGSESEAIYRQWYRTGYHRPQDDLAQPIDWKAAADFNRFFYQLVDRVANQSQVPAWKAGSPLRPKP
jgi:hypothetical protein